MQTKFIADVHLGKLARLLRLLGFDTLYKNSFTINEIIHLGKEQQRIILSGNASSINKACKVFLITSKEPITQLRQVVEAFSLKSQFSPFSRCLICNGVLKAVVKEEINSSLQENTSRYFNDFWQCKNCNRIYWKGSHYERMLQTIEGIIS
jgi:uncharacterized protein with PIN domain